MTERQLRDVLERLPVTVEDVHVEFDSGRFLAWVTSSGFEMDEGMRQALVWKHLLSELSDADIADVEFVFTQTPAERDQQLAS